MNAVCNILFFFSLLFSSSSSSFRIYYSLTVSTRRKKRNLYKPNTINGQLSKRIVYRLCADKNGKAWSDLVFYCCLKCCRTYFLPSTLSLFLFLFFFFFFHLVSLRHIFNPNDLLRISSCFPMKLISSIYSCKPHANSEKQRENLLALTTNIAIELVSSTLSL